jgi:dCTP deaminase
MMLNDKEIKKRIIEDDLIIIPHYLYCDAPEKYDASIQPCSYDLTLSKSFKRIKKQNCVYPNKTYVDLCEPIEYIDVPYDSEAYSGVVIGTGEFLLGASREIVTLPKDIGAMLITRSSLGRAGLMLTIANWIDPGYVGTISMQIFNASPNPIMLTEKLRVAQLVFFKLDEACEHPYYGKYIHQDSATGSRIFKDPETHRQ